jgi:hypothetical protein
VCEIGDQALVGGLRLNADTVDLAVVAYGDGDKKIYHAGHFDPPRFQNVWESEEQTIETGGRDSVAHPVTEIPALWCAILRCTTAVDGWAEDEEIGVSSLTFGQNVVDYYESGFNLSVTSAEFKWRVSNTAIWLLNTAGAGEGETLMDLNKWALVFRAWY